MAVRDGIFNICTFLERWNQFCISVVIARRRWTEVTNGLFCCIRSFGCLAEKSKIEKKERGVTPLSAWLMGRPRVYFNNASLLLLVVHVIIARSHDGKPRAGANTNCFGCVNCQSHGQRQTVMKMAEIPFCRNTVWELDGSSDEQNWCCTWVVSNIHTHT